MAQNVMARSELVTLVDRYFHAVDAKDLTGTLACLTEDVTFTIATYGIVYQGRDGEVREMFVRLFERYAGIWHGDFDHIVEPPSRIASRFEVRNTSVDGQLWRKSNSNFFRARDGAFDLIHVYMSGDNSLA